MGDAGAAGVVLRPKVATRGVDGSGAVDQRRAGLPRFVGARWQGTVRLDLGEAGAGVCARLQGAGAVHVVHHPRAGHPCRRDREHQRRRRGRRALDRAGVGSRRHVPAAPRRPRLARGPLGQVRRQARLRRGPPRGGPARARRAAAPGGAERTRILRAAARAGGRAQGAGGEAEQAGAQAGPAAGEAQLREPPSRAPSFLLDRCRCG